jgi:hypothetical protein|nr:MAG TPA: hypothetical protein [Caudoviricetes sp.]
MTLDEWIAFYNRKNPQDLFQPTEGYEFFFVPDKGFCEVCFRADMVIIAQLAGDARYFKEKVEEAARELGIHEGGTICIRKEIRAYARLFGYRIERTEELPDGTRRYYATHRDTGKWFLASPGYTYDETGTTAYLVTWEI